MKRNILFAGLVATLSLFGCEGYLENESIGSMAFLNQLEEGTVLKSHFEIVDQVSSDSFDVFFSTQAMVVDIRDSGEMDEVALRMVA